MTNDCLVTKLKSVVNNDNLEKLGVLRVVATKKTTVSTYTALLRIATNDTVTIKANGSGYFRIGSSPTEEEHITELTITAAQCAGQSGGFFSLYFKNDDYDVEITNKYSLTIFGTGYPTGNDKRILSINIDDLEYCSNLTKLDLYNSEETSGSIGSLKKLTNLVEFDLYNTIVVGNWDNIVSCMPNLTELRVPNTVEGSFNSISSLLSLVTVWTGTGVTGSVESFIPLINLGTSRPTLLSGAAETLAQGWIDGGKGDGTVVLLGSQMTINGDSAPRGVVIAIANGAYTLTPAAG